MYYYVVAVFNSTKSFTYSFDDSLDIGTVVEVPLINSTKQGVIVAKTQKPEGFDVKNILRITDFFYDEFALKTAEFIANYYFSDLASAIKLFTPSKKDASPFLLQSNIQKPDLTDAQTQALTQLCQNKKSLLFGVTGSGKTEVYISYVYQTLRQNKTALILLPEISLTPQIQKRLEKFFGTIVGVWHSKLTPKQKSTFLQKLYSGKIGLVVGARSALFLPLRNLGLIVVDEEHDDSYKSNQKPRYHARDMAIYIAHKKDIPVILASATPTLGSYQKFHTVKLPSSFIQTKKNYKFIDSSDFDEYFIDLLKQNKDNQSIVFIPTRGNFKYLQCKSCGEFITCPFCSVGMSIHVKSNALKCHYCSYTQALPQTCPSCSDVALSSKRIGTAEVFSRIEDADSLNPIQFDTDTITTNKKLKAALERFESGKSNLLVGTQMLSKGHDYPNVTLSIIVGIDYLLAQADYRAREKALSLFFQIAGRCGRNKDALVVTQTANAAFFQNYIGDYEIFLQEESNFRQNLYPPYTVLAKLLFWDKNKAKAEQNTQKVVQKLQNIDVEVVGHGANLIEKIAGKYRYHILLRAHSKKQMQNAIAKVYDATFEVDMDCIHFD